MLCSYISNSSQQQSSQSTLCLWVSSSMSPVAEGTHTDLARVTEQDQMIDGDP